MLVAPIIFDQFQRANESRAAHQAAQPNPVPATDAQQLAILRVILRENTFQGNPPPPPVPGELPRAIAASSIVLLSTTTAFCDETAARNERNKFCARLVIDDSTLSINSNAKIPKKLVEELVLANRKSYDLPNRVLANVVFSSREVVSQILNTNNSWDNFYTAFPHSRGFIGVSRAVLSPDGAHALIYVEHTCGGFCASIRLHYLVRTGSAWRTATKIDMSPTL